MSATLFVSPGTRLVAFELNATYRPSAETLGSALAWLPGTPALFAETSSVTCVGLADAGTALAITARLTVTAAAITRTTWDIVASSRTFSVVNANDDPARR